jgi:hypothetical protein
MPVWPEREHARDAHMRRLRIAAPCKSGRTSTSSAVASKQAGALYTRLDAYR